MGGSHSKPQVTIKLSYKPINDPITYPEDSKLITVTRSFYPTGSTQDFYRYTHKWDGKYRLAEIQDDTGVKIQRINEYGQNVASVAAYYWKHDKTGPGQKPSKVLLVEVVQKGGKKYSYYAKNAAGYSPPWHSVVKDTNETYKDEFLETYLDEQNCKHSHAVTIDLTKSNSKQGNRYCCPAHSPKGTSGRISVEEVQVRCREHSGSVSYYKHSVNTSGGVRVAAIKYYTVGVKRKRINIPDLNLPTKQSVSVSVFYSDDGGKDPVLIYVESTGGQDVKSWYQKGNDGSISSNDNEEWTQVGLDITLDKLTKPIDCGDSNFIKLVEVLQKAGCSGLQECVRTIDPAHLGQNGVQQELAPGQPGARGHSSGGIRAIFQKILDTIKSHPAEIGGVLGGLATGGVVTGVTVCKMFSLPLVVVETLPSGILSCWYTGMLGS
ncbi:hypothetical protein BEWA_020870 [Theileria equi strain WA]|uniref:Uncharacterized protein n=1 Tax=Theileria equi strain WA TaxID=1537102 RepID=L0AUK9_THEEQ|nr:hypothetical protein BEWA_020870 [Theileria equi strain WA]AFZ79240.1 hypothetical protein BEWA_020870 [Theileria equi strain WA]|eukprot:XP_004828906.1 hypothetical protein BEWA_020870 [Theileria equi strain WA]